MPDIKSHPSNAVILSAANESLYWHLHSPVLRQPSHNSGCPTLCALAKGGVSSDARPLSPHHPNPCHFDRSARRVETPVLALAVALRWHHQKSRHPERSERTTVLVFAFAFLSVIPAGNLLPHSLSANGAAISQPRAKPWVRTTTNPKG